MALAPYFNKAAVGAASLMQGVSYERFRQLVEPLSVTLAFGSDAAVSPEGRIILKLTVNLLARFYPALEFLATGEDARQYAAQLRELASAINPNIEFTETRPIPACIAVGNVSPPATFCVFLGSNDWVADVSTRAMRQLGSSLSPFGAAAAACFGVAFVFRHFFHSPLGVPAPDEEFSLSLASYELAPSSNAGPALNSNLGEIALVGVGAIGNGAVWVLSRTHCTGDFHLIDNETVDETNPQRYVLTTNTSPGRSKVDLATADLSLGTLTPHPHSDTWAGFISGRGHQGPRLVACALDTAEDRCGLQSSLPEFIVNAWTQRGDLGVSRHEFLSDSACLACLYWPETTRPNLDELVKQAIKYSGDIMEVRNMLYFRRLLDDQWLDRISRDMGEERSKLEPFRNKTLDEFYREGVCGGHIVAVQDANVEVPMPFQSAMAGVMLAAEIIKFAPALHLKDEIVTTKIDLLRPLGTRLSEKFKKRPGIACICRDNAYLHRYSQKYPHRAGQTPGNDCGGRSSVIEETS